MTKTTTMKIRYVPIFENRQWPIVCAILHCIPIILDIVQMFYISFKLCDYLTLINIYRILHWIQSLVFMHSNHYIFFLWITLFSFLKCVFLTQNCSYLSIYHLEFSIISPTILILFTLFYNKIWAIFFLHVVCQIVLNQILNIPPLLIYFR